MIRVNEKYYVDAIIKRYNKEYPLEGKIFDGINTLSSLKKLKTDNRLTLDERNTLNRIFKCKLWVSYICLNCGNNKVDGVLINTIQDNELIMDCYNSDDMPPIFICDDCLKEAIDLLPLIPLLPMKEIIDSSEVEQKAGIGLAFCNFVLNQPRMKGFNG